MRKLRKPINKELLEQLYVIEGKSSVIISKLLNIPPDRILYQLKKDGFLIRHPGSIGNEVKIKKEELYKLYYIDLKTQKEISEIYKVSRITIKNYLYKYGLKKKGEYRPKFCIRGNNHPTKRPEVKLKMSQNHADVSGDKNPNYGATWMVGDGNPNWLGGVSDNGYSWKFNEELKESIRNRDSNKCKECGLNKEDHYLKYNENLHVHHIDYNKQNCKEDNLITLCLKCNILANYNREQWESKFKGAKYGK